MAKWETLAPAQREAARASGIDALLTELETVAGKIQSRHENAFPENQGTVSGSTATQAENTGSASTQSSDDLSQRIQQFRSLQ